MPGRSSSEGSVSNGSSRMTSGRGGGPGQDWTIVDEGWGRRAVDFATLSEPANCREYVAVHQQLGVRDGDSLPR